MPQETVKRSRSLRPEAGHAQWGELDQTQQEACKRLVKMIAEAVDALGSKSGVQTVSRTAFVSGARGTGKTTVLESLIAYSKPGDTTETKDDAEVNSGLSTMRQRVVWLDKLDMEPIQEMASLLMAIFARIDASLTYHRPEPRSARGGEESWPQGILEPALDGKAALQDFMRLRTNAALGWNSNVDARKGQLDPDSYAAELMRGESARLKLGRELDNVLDKLAESLFRGPEKTSPLFVLPVDDLDLNPSSCLPLLRLLRLISARRLFIIVVGDENLADLVVNLQVSNDLARVAKEVSNPDQLSVPPMEIGIAAGNVAGNALRKLLPPAQRLQLKPMSLKEALNFRPLGSGATDPFLHQLLAKCPVDLSLAAAIVDRPTDVAKATSPSLLQLLLARDWKLDFSAAPAANELKTEDLDKAVYSGKGFLRAAPRRLADFWFAMKQIAEASPPGTPAKVSEAQSREAADDEPQPSTGSNTTGPQAELLVEHFANKCKRSLAAAWELSPAQRQLVEYAIIQDDKDVWQLHELPLRARSKTHPGITFSRMHALVKSSLSIEPLESKSRRPGLGGTPQKKEEDPGMQQAGEAKEEGEVREYEAALVCFRTAGWKFEAQGALGPPGASGPPGITPAVPVLPLEAETACELMVFHDLVSLRSGESMAGNPLIEPLRKDTSWAQTEWHHGEGLRAVLRWPLPPARRLLDFDLMLADWNRLIGKLASETAEPDAARVAYCWIEAGAAIVDGKPCQPLNGQLNWSALAERLVGLTALAARRGQTASAAHEWLISLALLLMPETGLPARLPAECKALVRQPALKAFWKKARLIIRRRRAARLAILVKEGMPDLAEKLYAETDRPGFGREHSVPKPQVYQFAGVEVPRGESQWQESPWPEPGKRKGPGPAAPTEPEDPSTASSAVVEAATTAKRVKPGKPNKSAKKM